MEYDRVDASAAVDSVVTGDRDLVVAGAADDILDRAKRGDLAQGSGGEIGAVGRPRRTGGEVDAQRILVAREIDRGGAGAAGQVVEGKWIVLVGFDYDVVAGTAVDGVDARPAVDDGVALAAMNDVITRYGARPCLNVR